MAESAEANNTDGGTGVAWLNIQAALRPAPCQFTVASFARRTYQNLLVYGVILVTALYVCVFVFAPVETSMFTIFCIGAGGLVILLSSSSRRKMDKVIGGGIAASYIVGAAALLKAFEAFLHRM